MKHLNKSAFTLVELIVVITILAILWTLAFISLSGYSKSARNSTRISDMKTIEKALSIYKTKNEVYPDPDDSTNIVYSGSLVWRQWIFSTGSQIQTRSLTSIPIDPLNDVNYSYSVSATKTEYQIGSMIEWWLISGTNIWIPQGYAVSSNDFSSYVLGNYIYQDVRAGVWTDCVFITAPSMLLSDIPAWGELIDGNLYNYSYTQSPNLPDSYAGIDNITPSLSPFQVEEVFNSCNISNMTELELYVAQMATAYQSLSKYEAFNELIFNFNTAKFRRDMLQLLLDRGVTASNAVIAEVNNPSPEITFTDTFTDTDSTTLVWWHTPDVPGVWNAVWVASEYTIVWNALQKGATSSSMVHPNPNPNISSPDYSIAFDINDFSAWNISIFLRYTDANNYYRLNASTSGYQIVQRIWWADTILQDINDPINNWDRLVFGISGNTVILNVAGIEKENNLYSGLNDTGIPLILLENSGAEIDTYTLIYK